MGEALLPALRRLLRPLVRLLLATGIPYPVFARLLKALYVEVALEEFRLPGRPQTDSRLSLLTGIHRKEVKRLRQEQGEPEGVPPAASLGARLVARWLALPEYLDAQGRPRPLPRSGSPTAGPGFDDLVASVSKDIRPRVVLDEWLRLGVAELDEQGRVCLRTEAFVPERGYREKAYYFGRNLHDHVAAGVANLLGRTPPLLERAVHYGGLSTQSLREVRRLAEKLGAEAIREVNRLALERQARDREDPSARARASFGVYFFAEEEEVREGATRGAPPANAGGDRV